MALCHFLLLFLLLIIIHPIPVSPADNEQEEDDPLKKLMPLEMKWEKLLKPLATLLYYANMGVNKERIVEMKETRENMQMSIHTEYLPEKIELPKNILEYSRRNFGGYKLPYTREKGGMLKGGQIKMELRELRNLYLDLKMYEEVKHGALELYGEKYKFNEKAQLLHQLKNGIPIQDIFTFDGAQLIVGIIVRTFLFSCNMNVSMPMEADNVDYGIAECILERKFHHRKAVENMKKIIVHMSTRKNENSARIWKKMEEFIEQIMQETNIMAAQYKGNYSPEDPLFRDIIKTTTTQSEAEKSASSSSGLRRAYYLDWDLLQNFIFSIKLLQFSSAIHYEIMRHVVNGGLHLSGGKLIDLTKHKNKFEFLQKHIGVLEGMWQQTILGIIPTHFEYRKKTAQLEMEWKELGKLKGNREEMRKKYAILEGAFDRVDGERERAIRGIEGTEEYGKGMEAYRNGWYSRIFGGFIPDLLVPRIRWNGKENLTIKDFKFPAQIKVEIMQMFIEIIIGQDWINENSLMYSIAQKEMFSANVNGGGMREFCEQFDNLTKMTILNAKMWTKFAASGEEQRMTHNIIASKMMEFVGEVLKNWKKQQKALWEAVLGKIPKEYAEAMLNEMHANFGIFDAITLDVDELFLLKAQKLLRELRELLNARQHLFYKPDEQFSMVYRIGYQPETAILLPFIQIFTSKN